MIREKILKVVTAATCIATLIMPHTSVVLAAALTNQIPNDVNTVKLSAIDYRENGFKYTFGGKTNILKVYNENDKENNVAVYSDAFYCLNGEDSFPTLNGAIEYERKINDFFAEKPLALSDENYNSLCWLLDNIYLPKQMSEGQREAQKDALFKIVFDELVRNGYEDIDSANDIEDFLDDDDIEVIQQWAIWYFANPNKKTIEGQEVPIEKDKLPTIMLTSIFGDVDNLDAAGPRYKALTALYKYFVTEASKYSTQEYIKANSITLENTNPSYVIEDNEYKVGPFKITATGEVSNNNFTINITNGTSELMSNQYSIKDANGAKITDVSQALNKDIYVHVSKNINITTLKLNVTTYETKASVWETTQKPSKGNYQPMVLVTREATPHSIQVNPLYDLVLRKYIVAVNGTQITDREPQIDISKLKNNTDTTAEYRHRKDPVEVKVGDTVTYRISVYNEGNIDAPAPAIEDYCVDGDLELIDVKLNNETFSGSNLKQNLSAALSRNVIPAFDKDNDTAPHFIATDWTFRVKNNVSGHIITNMAEIVSSNVKDRDSEPNNNKDNFALKGSEYAGKDNKPDLSDSNYYYKGYEDDDDFEKLVIAGKPFDLSLQKFITKVNGKEVDEKREPKENTTPLKNGSTNAEYTPIIKTPVLVQKGDIVTYTIRVYNEGEMDGYAENVADYLPDGLGYLVNYNGNIDNYWSIPQNSTSIKLSTITNGTKNLKIDDFTGVTDLANVDVVRGAVKLTSTALSSNKSENLLKAFDGSDKLSHKDIEITCIVLADSNLKNIAEITKNLDNNKNEVTDRDSVPDTVDPNNYPGNDENQDDNDYEILTMKKFDLALQKFITAVNNKEIKDREPKVSLDESKKIKYEHPTTALEVNNGDVVTYTIRVYNEGEVDGYAAQIGDDIPSGLVFEANNEVNKKYGWVMLDANGKETTDSSKAVEIRTDYLSKQKAEARKENALLTAFDSQKGNLFYLDVKAAFKVDAKTSNSTIINTAEITKDTDSDGNEIDDIDSTPDNKKDGEDDIDKERVHVGYFDLALQKDLTKAIITKGDSTKEILATNGELLKVEINKKKINSTIVKFVYNITIKNEGTIPGYAKEIKDYIPEGLQFVEADNKNWKADSDGTITTEALADKLLQPGETASVEVVLRWINGENNLGLKNNIAEISKDYNDAGDVDDIDSTPNNKKDGEDDIDDAPVILSISTGRMPIYIVLTTAVLTIIGAGVVAIKKYVL